MAGWKLGMLGGCGLEAALAGDATVLGDAVSRIRPPPQRGGADVPPAPRQLKLSLPWSSRSHGAAGNRGRAWARPGTRGGRAGENSPMGAGMSPPERCPTKIATGMGMPPSPWGRSSLDTMAKSQGWRSVGGDAESPGRGGGHWGGSEAQPPSFPPLGFLPLWRERSRSWPGISSATAPHRDPLPLSRDSAPPGTGGYGGWSPPWGWGTQLHGGHSSMIKYFPPHPGVGVTQQDVSPPPLAPASTPRGMWGRSTAPRVGATRCWGHSPALWVQVPPGAPRFGFPEPCGATLGISCPAAASAGYGHHRDSCAPVSLVSPGRGVPPKQSQRRAGTVDVPPQPWGHRTV